MQHRNCAKIAIPEKVNFAERSHTKEIHGSAASGIKSAGIQEYKLIRAGREWLSQRPIHNFQHQGRATGTRGELDSSKSGGKVQGI
jgi:hypothetical protein